jgi:hypothetical protein
MNRRRPLILFAAAALLAGCGYQHGGDATAPTTTASDSSGGAGAGAGGYHWRSIYRQDYHTIAIPIFKNNDYQRGVEFALSKAVVNQIEANTPYKVVPRERADTILEGEIVSVRVNTLSKDSRAGIPQDQLLDITVDFTWKDLKTGRILVSRRGMEQTSSLYPTLGEGRATGTQIATEKLAIAIVQELQSDW